MRERNLLGREVVGGEGEGKILFSEVGLSFWGGVDPRTGKVVDIHHPLFGESLAGKVVCLPGGRGSCTGSQTMLELILNKVAPAALVLSQPDEILALGVIVGEELFSSSFPIVHLQQHDLALLLHADYAKVSGSTVCAVVPEDLQTHASFPQAPSQEVALTAEEEDMLSGKQGKAAQVAMRIIVRVAKICGASELISVCQAHIDGCTYIGPGGLRFAQRLVEWGGKVRVPTSLNSISVDRRQWRALGIAPSLGEPASALADAYLALGAFESYTCAPYLLSTAPKKGDQIVWGESNAVAFANSALGARTQKYADYMDICAAITGRVPNVGCHLESERKATLILKAPLLSPSQRSEIDDSFYPTLGYLCGMVSGSHIPVLIGIDAGSMDMDALKAFSAAFATMASTPMFHIVGNTPEAPDLETALSLGSPRIAIEAVHAVQLTEDELRRAWKMLDSGFGTDDIELIAVGNPHLSLTETSKLAQLVDVGSPKNPNVNLIATIGRDVLQAARLAGTAQRLERFGLRFISDTCWCMLTEPVVPQTVNVLLTNSAKYAHYAPGLVGKKVRMSNLAGCIEAARTGRVPRVQPRWLGLSVRSFVTSCLKNVR